MSGIYAILNRLNGKRYYGSTSNFTRRWKEHLKALRAGRHCNGKLQHAFTKYGETAFQFSIVERCDIDQLMDREQTILDEKKPHRTGYNISGFADSGFRGRRWSRAERRQQSARFKKWMSKNGNPFSGRRHTKNSKRAMSVAKKGKGMGSENNFFGKRHDARTRSVMSANHADLSGSKNGMFGKTHSPEARRKISQARTCRHQPATI